MTGYVPNGVIPPKDGFDDYIEFEINEETHHIHFLLLVENTLIYPKIKKQITC